MSTLDAVRETWEEIVALGPRGTTSPSVSRSLDILREQVDGIVDSACDHTFQVVDWSSSEPGILSVGGRELPCYAAMQSPGTDGLRGTLGLRGYQSIWGTQGWLRYALLDDASTPQAVILARPEGPAIPEPMLPGALAIPHVCAGEEAITPLESALREKKLVQIKAPARLGRVRAVKNLIADSPGRPELPRILFCAHADSVYTTAGAYDNASGVAVLVGTARLVKALRDRGDACFAWFSGEEWGMLGSAVFAAENPDSFDLVINFDGVGRTPHLELWCGPEWLDLWVHGLFAQAGQQLGWTSPSDHLVSHCPPPLGSDHDPFFRDGLPVLMFTHNDQEIIHTSADVRTPEMWKHMKQLLNLLELLLPRLWVEFDAQQSSYEASRASSLGVGWSPGLATRISNVTRIRNSRPLEGFVPEAC